MSTGENQTQSVLRRKLTAPAGPFDAPGNTLAKTVRLAVVRAIEAQTGLEVAVAGYGETKLTLAGLAENITSTDLIFATQGPKNSAGLAVMDTAVVSGLVEHMITGRVIPGQGDDRKPTATDASVMRGILFAISVQIEDGLHQISDPPPIRGFRTGAVIEDARAVTLALGDIAYRCLSISLNMENGAKTGVLRLVFPWAISRNVGGGTSDDRAWESKWNAAIGRTNVSVEAVLLRRSMSLDQVSSLRVGDLIPFTAETLNDVSVVGRNRRSVGGGRLGQSNGHRAVLLTVGKPARVNQDSQLDERQISSEQGIAETPGELPDFNQSAQADPSTA